MKRIILLIFSLGIGLALIVACAQPANPTPEPPPVEEEAIEQPVVDTPTDTAIPPTETPTEAVVEEPEATEEVDDIEALIIDRCSACHSADRVFSADKTEVQWETTIDRMIGLGANVTDEEKTDMIDWLVTREN